MTVELLNLILCIAEKMVENGAEIYRIEEGITRMTQSYGVIRSDVYATTSNVIVTVENEDGSILTQTRRIKSTSIDIEKLHRLNSLVRNISTTAPDSKTIKSRLDEIEKTPEYSSQITILFYAAIAGAFCLFFGGLDYVEVMVSFLIGAIVGAISIFLEKYKFNRILGRFLCSFISATCAYIFLKFNVVSSVDNIIIGNIMTLIPGIGLTNSLRDLFTGDVITGILRSIEAVLLALAIAAGYIATAFIFKGGI